MILLGIATFIAPEKSAADSVHSPIYIEGDGNFTVANGIVAGSGTPGDPYVIDEWNISASMGKGILVANTSAYFVIRNVYVRDGTQTNDCIFLENCSNASVFACTTMMGVNGIVIGDGCRNVQVSDNICSDNRDNGVFVWISTDVLVSDNRAKGNGWAGVNCDGGQNVVVLNNTASDNMDGINIHDQTNCSVVGNQILNLNEVAGERRYGIGAACSHGVLIANNTIHNETNQNELHGAGISIQHALGGGDNMTVVGNSVSGWRTGIFDLAVHEAKICFNIISHNFYGIWLIGNRSTIYGNYLVNSTIQAITSQGTSISWNASYPEGGNYWSDYVGRDVKSGPQQDQPGSDGIGDTPYIIDANNSDCYPLINLSMGGMRPVASFNVSPESGDSETVFLFDASSCYDHQDPISNLQVRWDWQSDGEWDTGWTTNKTAEHKYEQSGNFTVSLEVRNSLGLTEIFEIQIHVTEPVQRPENRIAWTPWILVPVAVIVVIVAADAVSMLKRR